jgi:hypothetical protein
MLWPKDGEKKLKKKNLRLKYVELINKSNAFFVSTSAIIFIFCAKIVSKADLFIARM